MDDMSQLFTVLAVLIPIILVSLVVSAGMYILMGIIISNMAKANNLEDKAYFGWIPILNLYLMLKMAGEFRWKPTAEPMKFTVGVWVVVGASVVLSVIPILGQMASMAVSLYFSYLIYKSLFDKYELPESKGKAIITAIIGVTGVYWLWQNMKKPFVVAVPVVSVAQDINTIGG